MALTPKNKNVLIIVGPSGGYCLKTETLKNFKHILLVDKDPLAILFFRRQHPGLDVEFCNEDIFEKLRELIQIHQEASWLWSNLLGQLGLEIKDEDEIKARFIEVNRAMESKNWFSFHDVYSFAKKDQNVMIDHLTEGKLELQHKKTHTWDLDKSRRHVIESGYITYVTS